MAESMVTSETPLFLPVGCLGTSAVKALSRAIIRQVPISLFGSVVLRIAVYCYLETCCKQLTIGCAEGIE